MEYQVIIQHTAQAFEDSLNKATAAGWEVAHLAVDSLRYVAIVKRAYARL